MVMKDGTSRPLRRQIARAAATTLALAGAMGAGHAETAAELPVALAAPTAIGAAAPAAGARFVPSAPAEIAASLARQAPAPVVTHALDIAATPGAPAAEQLGRGVASFYARSLAGRPTASGERFDPAALTAAHRTLPFGSLVRVTNPRNGRTVVVRINDRGPFSRGRTIDLSPLAAERIGLVAAGHGTVELALLAP